MVNDVNIYIKVMLDLGYQIDSSDARKILFRSGARKFWSCFVNLGLSSYLMEKNVELYLDKPGGLFMVVYW